MVGSRAFMESVAIHERIANDVKRPGPVLAHGVEYGCNILGWPDLEYSDIEAEYAGRRLNISYL